MGEEEQNSTESQIEHGSQATSDPTGVTDGGQGTKQTSSSTEGRKQGKRSSKRTQEKTHQIKLHNNPEIPPNGLYVGVNGRWMMLKPNVEMEVPESALEVLDNAVREEAEKDEHNRVVGRREVPRFPYTVVKRK